MLDALLLLLICDLLDPYVEINNFLTYKWWNNSISPRTITLTTYDETPYVKK